MVSIDQIQDAHAQIQSGAEFPKYVQDLKVLGVASYDTFVVDGHAVYNGVDGESIESEAKYPAINISEESQPQKFEEYLKSHQNGETNFLIFCGHAAECGIWKWTVDTHKSTCTYFDFSGKSILCEQIQS